MIDGWANYTCNLQVEAVFNNYIYSIDAYIRDIFWIYVDPEDMSLLAMQKRAGLSNKKIRAIIKLVISGRQNVSKHTIAGIIAAILQTSNALETRKRVN